MSKGAAFRWGQAAAVGEPGSPERLVVVLLVHSFFQVCKFSTFPTLSMDLDNHFKGIFRRTACR